jgi:hypothetical protein
MDKVVAAAKNVMNDSVASACGYVMGEKAAQGVLQERLIDFEYTDTMWHTICNSVCHYESTQAS